LYYKKGVNKKVRLSKDSKEIQRRLRLRTRKLLAAHMFEMYFGQRDARDVLRLYNIFLKECWEAPEFYTLRKICLHPDFAPRDGKIAENRLSHVKYCLDLLVTIRAIKKTSSKSCGTCVELIIPDEVLIEDKNARMY
jgi:hypothetical protein